MFGRRKEFSAEEWDAYYDVKKAAIERVLGPMDDMVGHAVIPFAMGGVLDMYNFCSCIPGTVFCSMELIRPDGTGPRPSRRGTYEVVACTRHVRPSAGDESLGERLKRISEGGALPFEKMERRLCGIMTTVAFYSLQTVLNPGETCEFPDGANGPGHCVILDAFAKDGAALEIRGRRHFLLLCMEVFRSEMQVAMKYGSGTVITRLRERGYYPYSDLDREAVF